MEISTIIKSLKTEEDLRVKVKAAIETMKDAFLQVHKVASSLHPNFLNQPTYQDWHWANIQ